MKLPYAPRPRTRVMPASLCAASVLAMSALMPAAAEDAAVSRRFIERSAVAAVDASCRLFSDGEKLALASGLYQAEGELLRSGETPVRLRALADEAADHARALGCNSGPIREVAAQIRSAYLAFQRVGYLEYPGAHGRWAASRIATDQWSVKSLDAASGATFGLRRIDPQHVILAVTLPWAAARPPASVVLRMRDKAKLNEAWLGSVTGSTGKLAAPPAATSRDDWATDIRLGRDAAGAPLAIAVFPETARARLSELDPREAVAVEVTPSARDPNPTTRRFVFEVGDFRAASAFAAIPAPAPPPR